MVEYLVLLAAMLLAGSGYSLTAALYAIYTLLNALSAWSIASGRV